MNSVCSMCVLHPSFILRIWPYLFFSNETFLGEIILHMGLQKKDRIDWPVTFSVPVVVACPLLLIAVQEMIPESLVMVSLMSRLTLPKSQVGMNLDPLGNSMLLNFHTAKIQFHSYVPKGMILHIVLIQRLELENCRIDSRVPFQHQTEPPFWCARGWVHLYSSIQDFSWI